MTRPIDIHELERGRSFWREAYDKVMRDRLARAGLAVIWFIATVAVWAPLIANDKPYAIRAVFRERYENDYYVWLDSHEQYVEALSSAGAPSGNEPTAASAAIISSAASAASSASTGPLSPERAAQLKQALAKHGRLILDSIDDMRRHVPPELARTLAEQRAAYVAAMAKFADALEDHGRDTHATLAVATFAELKTAIEAPFDPATVTLIAATRWPAFRSLRWLEVTAMALWLLFHVAYLWRGWRFHATAYLIAAGLAAAAGGVWALTVPDVFDPTQYRRMIEAPDSPARAWLPPVFFGENENLTAEGGLPPTWWRAQTPEQRARAKHYHWMGTDDLGKDVLCRMIYGARVSMIIGLVAVGIYVSIGIVVGALAGYFGGWIDIGVSRLIEIMMCFPVFFLILAIVAYARPSIVTIMVVLGVTGWTGTARLQRGEFLRLGNQDFVQAVRALGGSHLRIIFRHILPNGIAPILVVASFGIASAILMESALSYLGFGVPQPHASWGNLLNSGAADIRRLWWLILFPGAAIFVTITAWNLFGEVLRDAIDPRLRD